MTTLKSETCRSPLGRSAGAVVLGLALWPIASNSATVYSTDFENWVGPSSTYQIYSGIYDGWTIGGTVDLIQGAHGAIDGKSIDLAGTPGPGYMERSYQQIKDYTYTLTWDYFRNFDNGLGDTHTVTFGGVTTSPYAVPLTIFRGATLSYVAASSGAATVRFASNGTSGSGYTNSFGATIDNVSITAVPEPEAYGLAMAGMGVVVAAMRRRRSS